MSSSVERNRGFSLPRLAENAVLFVRSFFSPVVNSDLLYRKAIGLYHEFRVERSDAHQSLLKVLKKNLASGQEKELERILPALGKFYTVKRGAETTELSLNDKVAAGDIIAIKEISRAIKPYIDGLEPPYELTVGEGFVDLTLLEFFKIKLSISLAREQELEGSLRFLFAKDGCAVKRAAMLEGLTTQTILEEDDSCTFDCYHDQLGPLPTFRVKKNENLKEFLKRETINSLNEKLENVLSGVTCNVKRKTSTSSFDAKTTLKEGDEVEVVITSILEPYVRKGIKHITLRVDSGCEGLTLLDFLRVKFTIRPAAEKSEEIYFSTIGSGRVLKGTSLSVENLSLARRGIVKIVLESSEDMAALECVKKTFQSTVEEEIEKNVYDVSKVSVRRAQPYHVELETPLEENDLVSVDFTKELEKVERRHIVHAERETLLSFLKKCDLRKEEVDLGLKSGCFKIGDVPCVSKDQEVVRGNEVVIKNGPDCSKFLFASFADLTKNVRRMVKLVLLSGKEVDANQIASIQYLISQSNYQSENGQGPKKVSTLSLFLNDAGGSSSWLKQIRKMGFFSWMGTIFYYYFIVNWIAECPTGAVLDAIRTISTNLTSNKRELIFQAIGRVLPHGAEGLNDRLQSLRDLQMPSHRLPDDTEFSTSRLLSENPEETTVKRFSDNIIKDVVSKATIRPSKLVSQLILLNFWKPKTYFGSISKFFLKTINLICSITFLPITYVFIFLIKLFYNHELKAIAEMVLSKSIPSILETARKEIETDPSYRHLVYVNLLELIDDVSSKPSLDEKLEMGVNTRVVSKCHIRDQLNKLVGPFLEILPLESRQTIRELRDEKEKSSLEKLEEKATEFFGTTFVDYIIGPLEGLTSGQLQMLLYKTIDGIDKAQFRKHLNDENSLDPTVQLTKEELKREIDEHAPLAVLDQLKSELDDPNLQTLVNLSSHAKLRLGSDPLSKHISQYVKQVECQAHAGLEKELRQRLKEKVRGIFHDEMQPLFDSLKKIRPVLEGYVAEDSSTKPASSRNLFSATASLLTQAYSLLGGGIDIGSLLSGQLEALFQEEMPTYAEVNQIMKDMEDTLGRIQQESVKKALQYVNTALTLPFDFNYYYLLYGAVHDSLPPTPPDEGFFGAVSPFIDILFGE